MLRKQLCRLAYINAALLLISYIIGQICFYLQENVYTEPNSLYEMEKALGFQTSSTSFVYPFIGCFMGLLVDLIIMLLTKDHDTATIKLFAYLVCIGMAVYGIGHEIGQMIQKPYPDNNWLDMVLSTVACLMVLLYVRKFYP